MWLLDRNTAHGHSVNAAQSRTHLCDRHLPSSAAERPLLHPPFVQLLLGLFQGLGGHVPEGVVSRFIGSQVALRCYVLLLYR